MNAGRETAPAASMVFDRTAEPPGVAAGLAAGLAANLAHCRLARGRWHGARAWAEAVHAALLPRFVSTVAVLAALLALALGIAWLAG